MAGVCVCGIVSGGLCALQLNEDTTALSSKNVSDIRDKYGERKRWGL